MPVLDHYVFDALTLTPNDTAPEALPACLADTLKVLLGHDADSSLPTQFH